MITLWPHRKHRRPWRPWGAAPGGPLNLAGLLRLVAALSMVAALAALPGPAAASRPGAAQTVAGSVRIVPATAHVAPGESVTVEVWLEDGVDYYGLDVRITFDPQVVSVPAGRTTLLWDVFDEDNHSVIRNRAENDDGEVWYAVTNLNPAEAFTGTGRVCAITFQGHSEGTTELEIHYAKGGTRTGGGLYPARVDGEIVVAGEGTNVPPTAHAGGPYSGTRVDTVTLDGTGSFDPDGIIESYAWSVGSALIHQGPAPTHTLELAGYALGEHDVSLTVTDDGGATASDTATLTVQNAPPVAVDVAATTDQNTPVAIDVLANDYDPDGELDPTTVAIGTGPAGGAAEVDPLTGLVTYTPAVDFTGVDAFTYTVDDDDGATSNEATVTVTVSPDDANQPPVADAGGPYAGDRTETVTLDGTGSTDPDGTIVNYRWQVDGSEIYSGPAPTVDLALAGYDPGVYAVVLVVTDDEGATAQDATSLEVINQPPVADAGGPYAGDRTETVTLDGTGSTDPDGTIVNYRWQVDGSEIYSGPAPTVDLALAGYDPGAYDVVLVVTDDDGATAEDTTSLTVSNAPPVAVDVAAATDQNTPVAIDVLANDYDPDGELDPTTVAIASGPEHGTLAVDPATGVVTYTPAVDFTGVDAFTYTVDDDDGATSNAATVTVTVSADDANQPPVAVDDSAETGQDLPVAIDVLANDYDPDGELDPTTVTIVTGPENGAVAVDPHTGVVTYTPAVDFSGVDAFTYTVDDDDGATSNAATVTVTVNPAPVISHLDLDSAPVGSPGLVLTIYGSHFVSSSTVHWDGEARVTTYVSGTELRAAIWAADLSEAGVVELTVVNPPLLGGTSNAIAFMVMSLDPDPDGHTIYLPLVTSGGP